MIRPVHPRVGPRRGSEPGRRARSRPGQEALEQLRRRWLAALATELPEAVRLRQVLHANPALSGHEEPAAVILEQTIDIPLERIADTGRIGRLGPARPAVLLRAELDALPLVERTRAPYAATSGAMHACGHDVHQAALVAVVRAARGLDLPAGLVPLFQPREETYPSGARDVVESGALTRYAVVAAIGVHVHPQVPFGAVATGAGVVNAAADEIEIIVRGDGGHGAYPHRAADPVSAVAHLVIALPELLRRTVSPMRPCALSVGHLQAGEPRANVLPSVARLLATMRTTDAADRRAIQEAIRHLASHQAQAFGLTAEVNVTAGEPVLANDPELVTRMDRWLGCGGLLVTEPLRSMGSDDFSYFAQAVPSVMAFVGTQVAGHGTPPQLHHPEFLPTDEAVQHVATALISGYLAASESLRSTSGPSASQHGSGSPMATPRDH